MLHTNMRDTTFERELHKGSAEMLILSLLEDGQRHGYDIAKIIGQRSEGHLSFHIASLYATLYRLERRGLIQGRWGETPDVPRRRYYPIAPAGPKLHAAQRSRSAPA